jgi:hypothetical protein
MSYSDFKEQKGFNFRPAFFSGVSVEAADNLSDTLTESTAFFQKSFPRTFAQLNTHQKVPVCFEQAGYSRDSNESRNPKVQVF